MSERSRSTPAAHPRASTTCGFARFVAGSCERQHPRPRRPTCAALTCFMSVCVAQRVLHAHAVRAQRGRGAAHHVRHASIRRPPRPRPAVRELRREADRAIAQQLAEHDVAHAEAERGQIDAAERLQQLVVASAAADRAQLALRVEQLEDDAGVVRQPAHDREIERRPSRSTPSALETIESSARSSRDLRRRRPATLPNVAGDRVEPSTSLEQGERRARSRRRSCRRSRASRARRRAAARRSCRSTPNTAGDCSSSTPSAARIALQQPAVGDARAHVARREPARRA